MAAVAQRPDIAKMRSDLISIMGEAREALYWQNVTQFLEHRLPKREYERRIRGILGSGKQGISAHNALLLAIFRSACSSEPPSIPVRQVVSLLRPAGLAGKDDAQQPAEKPEPTPSQKKRKRASESDKSSAGDASRRHQQLEEAVKMHERNETKVEVKAEPAAGKKSGASKGKKQKKQDTSKNDAAGSSMPAKATPAAAATTAASAAAASATALAQQQQQQQSQKQQHQLQQQQHQLQQQHHQQHQQQQEQQRLKEAAASLMQKARAMGAASATVKKEINLATAMQDRPDLRKRRAEAIKRRIKSQQRDADRGKSKDKDESIPSTMAFNRPIVSPPGVPFCISASLAAPLPPPTTAASALRSLPYPTTSYARLPAPLLTPAGMLRFLAQQQQHKQMKEQQQQQQRQQIHQQQQPPQQPSKSSSKKAAALAAAAAAAAAAASPASITAPPPSLAGSAGATGAVTAAPPSLPPSAAAEVAAIPSVRALQRHMQKLVGGGGGGKESEGMRVTEEAAAMVQKGVIELLTGLLRRQIVRAGERGGCESCSRARGEGEAEAGGEGSVPHPHVGRGSEGR